MSFSYNVRCCLLGIMSYLIGFNGWGANCDVTPPGNVNPLSATSIMGCITFLNGSGAGPHTLNLRGATYNLSVINHTAPNGATGLPAITSDIWVLNGVVRRSPGPIGNPILILDFLKLHQEAHSV